MRILVGEISSSKAIVICRFIKTNYPDAEILTYDYRPFTNMIRTGYSDKHFVIPQNDSINALSQLISSNSVDCFISVMSSEIENILLNRNRFGKTLDYIGSLDSYRTLHYKNNFMELANSLGIRIPAIYNSIDEAIVPFIIKPVNSSSASGVRYIFTENDRGKLNKNEYACGFIIQEYIKGFGTGYSVFCNNGEINIGYGHKRLAEYPITGGSSVFRTSFEHSDMNIIAGKLISAVEWSGFCMFEFKITETGEVVLLEANPRIWGSINQGLSNGVNFFEPLLGISSLKINKVKNRNTYLSPLIYLAMMKYLMIGKTEVVKRFITDFSKKADVSIFNDFFGFLNLIVKKIKYF